MADSTQIDVFAMTPGHTFSIPISMGLPNNNIREVNPVRQGNGLWIGKMKPEPENASLINSEIVVGRDKVTSDYQYYYTDLSVAEVIELINNGPISGRYIITETGYLRISTENDEPIITEN